MLKLPPERAFEADASPLSPPDPPYLAHTRRFVFEASLPFLPRTRRTTAQVRDQTAAQVRRR